ncbi:MAG: hypothetical protein JXB25_11095 [Deltaproteobacteria bacterium]|nr:hypothetical protein [Deltaproteobacteria bacterium]
MKSTDLLSVSLKIMGIYFVFLGLTDLPSALLGILGAMKQIEFGTFFVLTTAVHGLSYFLFGSLLILFSSKIAKFIGRDSCDLKKEKDEFVTSSYLTLGLIILGFFILSSGLPRLVQIIFAIYIPALDSQFAKVLIDIHGNKKAIIPWSSIVAVATEIYLSIWLIFGSKGIVTFLKKVREGGKSPVGGPGDS